MGITLKTALIDDQDEDDTDESKEEKEDISSGTRRQLRMTVGPGDLVSVNGVEVDPDNLDERASNGVVHFIDEVIYPIPTGSIIDTLKADRRFTVLVDLIEAADLEEALNSTSA